MGDDVSRSPIVVDAQEQLVPLLEVVIDAVREPGPQVFFTMLALQLQQARQDVELLEFFLQLSTTAFQGFVFSLEEERVIDALLAQSEQISWTLSVESAQPH